MEIARQRYGISDLYFDVSIKEHSWSLFLNWIYRDILNFRSYYIIAQCSVPQLVNASESYRLALAANVTNVIELISVKVIASHLGNRNFYVTTLVVNESRFMFELQLSDIPSPTATIVVSCIGGFIVCVLIASVLVLYYFGYLSFIRYYFRTRVYDLPEEISWSFLLHLKFPYKVCLLFIFFPVLSDSGAILDL
jgi:hypothetical protein